MYSTTISSKRVLLIIAAVGVVAAAGCARSLVTTTIGDDGSYRRDLKFVGPASGAGSTPGQSLPDIFVLPAGTAWTSNLTKGKDETVYTAQRQFGASDTDSNDLVIKDGQSTELSNSAAVRQVSPGVWEYREVLHWSDKPGSSGFTITDPKTIAQIKGIFPTSLATDANAKAFADAVAPAIVRAMFGPPRPLLTDLLANPDLASNLLVVSVGKDVENALVQQFGSTMSDSDRAETMRKFIVLMTDETREQGQAQSGMGGNNSSSNSGPPVAMTFVVKPPGKIISTNGIVNEYTGEVFWGMYPEAATLGDIVLTADYQAPGK